ncbi:MAG TPA: hypothetical protein VJJ76_01820 [archaeon]|nr:hypothetical protein [archaeon]
MGVGKLLLGAVLLIGGLYVIWQYTLRETWIVLQGIIPPLVVLLGAFIVWLEIDEMKLEKELRRKK